MDTPEPPPHVHHAANQGAILRAADRVFTAHVKTHLCRTDGGCNPAPLQVQARGVVRIIRV
jgi:hypothetical protein